MEVESSTDAVCEKINEEVNMSERSEANTDADVTTQESAPETPVPLDIEGDGILSMEDLSIAPEVDVSAVDPATAVNVEPTVPSETIVVALRNTISPELSALLTDNDCLRFLRARSNNVSKAADMITKWGVWWETKLPGTDVLPREVTLKPDEQEQVYTDLMPHANLGESKTGCPIYWEKTGQISAIFPEVKKRLTEDAIFVRHIRQQEVMIRRLKNASARHGRPIEKQVIVMDMKNVAMSLDFMALRVFKRTVVIDEACYPERLETLFMINAPFTFSVLWAMIKPWIDPVTVAKFKILGSNYQSELKAHIAEDQIPVEYGGTWEDFGWTYPKNIAAHDRHPNY